MSINNIFAKISLTNDRNIYKLISDHKLFETLDVTESCLIPYNSTHKLDEECWFRINDFSSQAFFLKDLKDFCSIDCNQLDKKMLDKVSFIFSEQGSEYYFQKITSGKIIKKKRWIDFGETAKIQEVQEGFTINDLPDAVYLKEKDVLVFKNLERISSIFKGIDILYREATNEETKIFLESSFISLNEPYGSDHVKKANRKRIALYMKKMNELNENAKEKLISYISEYCPSLRFDKENRQFHISNEEELKNLLYGIAENYYTTEITNERRKANSTQVIN